MKLRDQLERDLIGIDDPLPLLEAIFSRSPHGMQVYRAPTEVVLSNPAFFRMFGATPTLPPFLGGLLINAFAGVPGDGPLSWRSAAGAPITAQEADRLATAFTTTAIPLRRNGLVVYVAVLYEDETAAQQAQRALADSETRYRLVFEQSADPAHIFDAETGRIEDVNAAWCRALGYTAEEARTLTVVDISDEKDATRAGVEKLLETGHVVIPARRLRRKDGSTFLGELSCSQFDLGPRTKVMACVRDITERRRREEELRLSQERFSRVFQSSAVPMAIMTADDGHLLDVNEAWAAFIGGQVERLRGRSVGELGLWVDPSDGDVVARELRERGAARNILVRVRRLDGALRVGLLCADRIPVREPSRPLVIVTVTDVTEREIAQERLAESERRFREITETIQEAFWVRNLEATVIHYVSPAYERIWGRKAQDLYRTPREWLDAIHPDDRAGVLQALEKNGTNEYAVEYRIERRPDGAVRWIRDHGFPVRDAAGRIIRVIGIAQDITDQRDLTLQLHQAQKMEAIGRLAGGVAHDFNNLLTAILGLSEILVDTFAADDPRKGDMEEIHRTGQRAAALTRQLLAFSRQQVMQPQTLPMNRLFDDMREMLNRLIGEDVQIVPDLAIDAAAVRVDPFQFGQVVMNLVINARDAMPDGGTIRIETRNVNVAPGDTASEDLAAGAYVRMTVRDTGCGIPPMNLSKIFEPFFTTKGVGKGTGLGLPTAYGIVRQSGGTLTVESTVNAGSAFHIFLPRAETTAAV